MPAFLIDGETSAATQILLAHGAGAPMDSPFMQAFAALLAARGCRVARFEFAYMAARRLDGRRRPPPAAEKLMPEFVNAVAGLDASAPIVIAWTMKNPLVVRLQFVFVLTLRKLIAHFLLCSCSTLSTNDKKLAVNWTWRTAS